ncbi:hypothetical protein HanXRQr2_Chr03g0119711 [Helianthus annuus]|uniref:Uncharacterized protein n=1 Tax=Helianthus annuus TaxID=4232 RepID=A0A9K3NVT8_HELAN|nr:hypothetical protein HanXRQr2_Chr03g0119711 [Helianthus annuus]
MTLYLIHFILIKPYTTLSADTPSSFPPIFSNPLTLSKQKENTDINLHLLQRNPSIHTERQSNAWPPSLSSPSRFLSTTQQEIQAFKHHPQPNNPTGGLANVYRLMVGAVLPTTTPPLSFSLTRCPSRTGSGYIPSMTTMMMMVVIEDGGAKEEEPPPLHGGAGRRQPRFSGGGDVQ